MGQLNLYKGPMAKFHKLPFRKRFNISLLFILLLWGIIAILAYNDKAASIINSILSFVGILLLILLAIGTAAFFGKDKIKEAIDHFKNQKHP